MHAAFPFALIALAAAAQPIVLERSGDIYYRAADGAERRLTDGAGYSEARLSPDGRTAVFVHRDKAADANGWGGETSLWIADLPTGRARRLLAPKPDDDVKRDMGSFRNPVFSLDGGYVYVEADAWATSSAIHQVSLATGRERFVVDGWLYGVLRNGPYRGYLVVGQHRYFGPPNYGSYNPVSVVRPDGKVLLRVPGSDKDDGETSLERWLRSKGWTL